MFHLKKINGVMLCIGFIALLMLSITSLTYPQTTLSDLHGMTVSVPSEERSPDDAEITFVTHNADWTPVRQTFGKIDMVQVPPGCFEMGGETLEENALLIHEQCFDAPFWIGETEVSNAQYAAFMADGGYTERRYWTDAGWEWKRNRTHPSDYDGFTNDNQPRVGVSWYEAVAYTYWLTEQLRTGGAIGQNEVIRLATEPEWEYAARGPDGLLYPWGNDFDGTRLNFCDVRCTSNWRDTSVDDGYGDTTAPVGSYPQGASWVGALDMNGNVSEWVMSAYADYPYDGNDGRNDISGDVSRVMRCGAWFSYPVVAMCRYHFDAYSRSGDFGFRVVLSRF